MTTATYIRQYVIPSAYALLPAPMRSVEATALLCAIALQESRAEHRCQALDGGGRGPARGFWQFERAGVSGVVTHKASAPYLRLVCATLRITPMPSAIYEAIEHNDVLAACCARLLVYTLPMALPTKDDPDEAWNQYIAAWRPGRPRRESWFRHYNAGWALAES